MIHFEESRGLAFQILHDAVNHYPIQKLFVFFSELHPCCCLISRKKCDFYYRGKIFCPFILCHLDYLFLSDKTGGNPNKMTGSSHLPPSPLGNRLWCADVWICSGLNTNMHDFVSQCPCPSLSGKNGGENWGGEVQGRSRAEKAWKHPDVLPVCGGNKMSPRQSNIIIACRQAQITNNLLCLWYSIKNDIN